MISATAIVQEAAEQSGGVPTVMFGVFAFAVLVVALVVTTMIDVDH